MKKFSLNLNTVLSTILTVFLFASIVVIVSSLANLRDTNTLAASQPKNPGTIFTSSCNSSGASPSGWTSPTNISSSNDAYAQATYVSGNQNYTNCLVAENFGFTIPTGATNLSAIVSIERKKVGSQFTSYQDHEVSLLGPSGSISGNLCDGTCQGTPVPTSDTAKTFTYSGSGLSPNVVNSGSFKVVYKALLISATAQVDHIQITVNYTPPTPANGDIKVNGQDGTITIAYGASATISWTSTNASSCSVSPPGWTGTSNPGISNGPLTSARTYTLNCSGSGGADPTPDSVTVNVGAPPDTGGDDGGGSTDGGGGSDGGGSDGGGTNGGNNEPPAPVAAGPATPPGFGSRPLPPSNAPTNQPVAGILNILNVKLSLPHILGKTRLLFVIGGYSYELDAKADSTEYQIDLRAANFPLGKDIDLALGGQFLLIKKAKLNPKTENLTLDLGELPMGDLNNDNRINSEDQSILLRSVGRSNGGDINNDGVTNSFDWAIYLKYNGKNGD